jgi:hypothetical protein
MSEKSFPNILPHYAKSEAGRKYLVDKAIRNMKMMFSQIYAILFKPSRGGDWGGSRSIEDNYFPQRMRVDYVRVYQQR